MTLKEELEMLSGYEIRTLHAKLGLPNCPKGKDAKKNTIEKILIVPVNGHTLSTTAIRENGRALRIKGSAIEIARELKKRGLLDKYYKVMPHNEQQWTETVRQTIRENSFGPPTPANVGIVDASVVPPIVPPANVGIVAASVVPPIIPTLKETANASIQATENVDLKWYETLHEVTDGFDWLKIKLEDDAELPVLLRCSLVLESCAEKINLCAQGCTMPFQNTLNELAQVMDEINTKLDEKIGLATKQFEKLVDTAELFLRTDEATSFAMMSSAKIIIALRRAYSSLTGSSYKPAVVNDLEAIIENLKKRKADEQEDTEEPPRKRTTNAEIRQAGTSTNLTAY